MRRSCWITFAIVVVLSFLHIYSYLDITQNSSVGESEQLFVLPIPKKLNGNPIHMLLLRYAHHTTRHDVQMELIL